jgi:hypothetical protein
MTYEKTWSFEVQGKAEIALDLKHACVVFFIINGPCFFDASHAEALSSAHFLENSAPRSGTTDQKVTIAKHV